MNLSRSRRLDFAGDNIGLGGEEGETTPPPPVAPGWGKSGL